MVKSEVFCVMSRIGELGKKQTLFTRRNVEEFCGIGFWQKTVQELCFFDSENWQTCYRESFFLSYSKPNLKIVLINLIVSALQAACQKA